MFQNRSKSENQTFQKSKHYTFHFMIRFRFYFDEFITDELIYPHILFRIIFSTNYNLVNQYLDEKQDLLAVHSDLKYCITCSC